MGFLRDGALEKSHPTKVWVETCECETGAVSTSAPLSVKAGQARPMIDAVAINSSSKASDTSPDTE
jgi:hypothetical protein